MYVIEYVYVYYGETMSAAVGYIFLTVNDNEHVCKRRANE